LVPFKEEIFPVLRRVKVFLSWIGKGNNSACLWVNDSRPGHPGWGQEYGETFFYNVERGY
jgi:hypothetical protein